MARVSNSQRLRDTHAEALRQFDAIQSALRNERLQCLQDRRFYSIAGAQWEGPLEQQYENKPKFEVNKVGLAVQRVVNEYRNNRITVDFVSRDGSPTEMADVCNKLFRADEQDSTANEAYDNAFEEAVGGGFGAWRLKAAYEDETCQKNGCFVHSQSPLSSLWHILTTFTLSGGFCGTRTSSLSVFTTF
jgi:hypothetical protein